MRSEEVQGQVERDARDQNDQLRQRTRDHEQAEQHLDRAGDPDELGVADRLAERLRDVEVDDTAARELARQLRVRALLRDGDRDQRRADGEL